MVALRAGMLRHQVSIQEMSNTGATDRGWKDAASWGAVSGSSAVMASVDTLTGREAEVSRQIVNTADTKIVLRYRDGISNQMRVLFGTRVFNIGHINNVDQRGRVLELICTEQTT